MDNLKRRKSFEELLIDSFSFGAGITLVVDEINTKNETDSFGVGFIVYCMK